MTNTLKTAMPYERFVSYGAESLTDVELLAIILRTGTKEKSAMELANDILHLHSSMQGKLIGLHHISLEELQRIPGIGEVKADKDCGKGFFYPVYYTLVDVPDPIEFMRWVMEREGFSKSEKLSEDPVKDFLNGKSNR